MHAVLAKVALSAAFFTLIAGRAAVAADARAQTVTVESKPVTIHFRAYAQVEPIAMLPLRTAQAGVVGALQVRPGSVVQTGQRLAMLGGPEIRALLTRRQGAVRNAKAQLTAARRTLAAQRQQLTAQLSTRQALARAQSAVTVAASALDRARAELDAARQMRMLRAPSAGIVTALDAADGERVAAGQAVLRLQPSHGLWLKAAYYGANAGAIRVGMTGRFQPASRGAAVPVQVVTVFGVTSADGGESVGLMPVGAAGGSAKLGRWRNGESGLLTLDGPTQTMIGVPTRALVLDAGQWWVLVRTPQGDRRQAVVPGPTRGWQTFLQRGLQPGQHVVVENAFLEYHRGISARYQPPD